MFFGTLQENAGESDYIDDAMDMTHDDAGGTAHHPNDLGGIIAL